MGVEIDHDPLVGLRGLDQPLAFLAGVVGLGIAGRREVPGVDNFDRVTALICGGKQTDWLFSVPSGRHLVPACSSEPANRCGSAGGCCSLLQGNFCCILLLLAQRCPCYILPPGRGLPLSAHRVQQLDRQQVAEDTPFLNSILSKSLLPLANSAPYSVKTLHPHNSVNVGSEGYLRHNYL